MWAQVGHLIRDSGGPVGLRTILRGPAPRNLPDRFLAILAGVHVAMFEYMGMLFR